MNKTLKVGYLLFKSIRKMYLSYSFTYIYFRKRLLSGRTPCAFCMCAEPTFIHFPNISKLTRTFPSKFLVLYNKNRPIYLA